MAYKYAKNQAVPKGKWAGLRARTIPEHLLPVIHLPGVGDKHNQILQSNDFYNAEDLLNYFWTNKNSGESGAQYLTSLGINQNCGTMIVVALKYYEHLKYLEQVSELKLSVLKCWSVECS